MSFLYKQANPGGVKKEILEGPFEGGVVVSSVPSRWMLEPCYMHSFALTEHYYILIEQVSLN